MAKAKAITVVLPLIALVLGLVFVLIGAIVLIRRSKQIEDSEVAEARANESTRI
jgi:hypothetical protein